MVPLRAIAEIFGAKVDWIAEARNATFVLGSLSLIISADEPLPNDMGIAHNVDGRIFVPVAYIVYELGAQIRWDGLAQAVYVMAG